LYLHPNIFTGENMTKDEALRLALEALEGVLDDSPKVMDASISGGLYEVVQCRDAITAIKAALEAPHELTVREFNQMIEDDPHYHKWLREREEREELEANDEPVAWQYRDANDDGTWSAWIGCDKRLTESAWRQIRPLYTIPPQRTWVGLTDEEIKEIVGPWGDTPVTGYTRKLFDQIEAKLKEKNT
jgi:hypothetical protein